MIRRITFVLLLVGLVGLLTAPAVAAQPQNTGVLNDIPVVGTIPGGTFEGVLDITQLEVVNGVLTATGTLIGTATQGSVVTEITQEFTDIPLSLLSNGVGAACDILTLDLGPLHLDLLGLVVDLSAVELDITAVPGPGNLLGNLLCAVAGLLDNNGPLGNLLNGLLGVINNILG